MIVSEKKKRENIAEYVIYMWQLEDIVRAHGHDAGSVYRFIMGEAQVDPQLGESILKWYQDICNRVSKLSKGAHLEEVSETLQELSLLHGMLLTTIMDADYLKIFENARSAIEELKERAGTRAVGDVEACFNGMYGIFLLDIQKKEISKATKDAIIPIRELLKALSQKYTEMKKGELNFSLN